MGDRQADFHTPEVGPPPHLLRPPLASALAGHPFGPKGTSSLSPFVNLISHTCDLGRALRCITGFPSDYSNRRAASDGP